MNAAGENPELYEPEIVPVAPDHGGTCRRDSARLEWRMRSSAKNCLVWVATDKGFDFPTVFKAEDPHHRLRIPADRIKPGERYFWKVTSGDKSSFVREFTVQRSRAQLFADALRKIRSIFSVGLVFASFVGSLLVAYKFLQKPSLAIGMLPYQELLDGRMKLGDMGRRVPYDEFAFSEKYLAVRTSTPTPFKFLEKYPLTTRHLRRAPDNVYFIPMIIYNEGNSILKDYSLSLLFFEKPILKSSRIRILDGGSEAQHLDAVFAGQDFTGFSGKRDMLVDGKIYKTYSDIGLPDQRVDLDGDLPARDYQMFYVHVRVPPDVSEFCITYEVGAGQFDYITQQFVQLVVIGG